MAAEENVLMSAILDCFTTEEANALALNQGSRIEKLECELAKMPQAEMPVTHVFTPGLYTRTILMRKGIILTSKIHKTEHPFVIVKGSATVVDSHGNRELLVAPHMGITKPGTHRALLIHEDCIWVTFHPTNKTSVEEIERDIIEPHNIPEVADGSRCLPNDGGKIIYFSPRLMEDFPC
jgi:hypothetical protein